MPARRAFLTRTLQSLAGLVALPALGGGVSARAYATGGTLAGLRVSLGAIYAEELDAMGATLLTSRLREGDAWLDTSSEPPVLRYWRTGAWRTDAEIAAESGAPATDDPHDPWSEAA